MKKIILIIVLLASIFVLYNVVSKINSTDPYELNSVIDDASKLSQKTAEKIIEVGKTFGNEAADAVAGFYARYSDKISDNIVDIYSQVGKETRRTIEKATKSFNQIDLEEISEEMKSYSEETINKVFDIASTYGKQAALDAKKYLEEKGEEGLEYLNSDEFKSKYENIIN